MRIPEHVTVQVRSNGDDDPSDLILVMTVSTGQRNPRRLLFPKTDAAGRTAMSGSEFRGLFQDATESDVMGSWGGIDEASTVVEISLYDPSPARVAGSRSWPLGDYEKTKWSSVAAEYAYRMSCRNERFEADPIAVDVRIDATIHFHIRRKPGPAG